MLKSGSAAAQAFAAQGTANVAAYSKAAQKTIAAAGSIPLLLGLLGVGKAQKPAACALSKLAYDNPEIQAEVHEAGGIAPLLALLNGLDADAQVQAAAALSEMARDNLVVQAAIAKAGGIGPLLSLLGSRSSPAQSMGMAALAALARNNRENQDAIAKQGGIKPLVQLLEQLGAQDAKVGAMAALALMEVARANAPNQREVVDTGGVSQLANLMKTSQYPEVKAEVAGALWALSEDDEIKVQIADQNTISPLVHLLGSGDDRACLHASGAIGSLGLNNNENQKMITQMLIELLINGQGPAPERAVTALNALVRANPSAHDAIAQSGKPEAVVELLKHGIPDAKDYALWSLSLSISSDNQGTVAEAGGVQPLIEHLGDNRTVIQEQAAAAIAKLAHDNDETRTAISKLGGVKPLIELLTSGASADGASAETQAGFEIVRQNAADALANLAVEPAARDEIVSRGGIPPLVTLLGMEGNESKKFAATAIGRLSKDHEETQAAIAAAGAIVPLVALLDGNQGPEAQEEAAGAILALAANEVNRATITDSGGIGWLVMLLGCDNPRAREHAEGALVCLSIENANRVLIIKKLVDMLQESGSGSSSGSGQEQAAAALANLARESEDNRKSIVETNGIVPLLDLVESASPKAKENAVGAIKELCRNSKNNQALIAKAGGIAKLVGVLAGFSANTMKENTLVQLCTLAASAIKEMAKDNKKNQDAITDAGAIAPLVAMLMAPAAEMQANAAGALSNLARNHADNQHAIARTGAIAPLCTLMKEGSDETKDESAATIWALAVENGPNKDTIAKLGGVDPLLGLLVTGTSERSQECVAGALAALASKHQDNRQVIAKRLVGLLGSAAVRESGRAQRVLMTCASLTSDSAANQVALAKIGGIAPLISWLQSANVAIQAHAAQAVLSLATDNAVTQLLIAKSDGIPPLIGLVKRSSPDAQEYAARALWHLASQVENRKEIVDAGVIKPLIAMLAADGDLAPELAAIILVRLCRGNAEVATEIASSNGILPLVKLLGSGSSGSQLRGASCLAELALVPKNRDMIANAGGIEPIIKLLTSAHKDSPETAARVLAHLSHADSESDEAVALRSTSPDEAKGPAAAPKGLGAGLSAKDLVHNEDDDATLTRGSKERRAAIHMFGGIQKLISMLDGTNIDTSASSPGHPLSRRTDAHGGVGLKEDAGTPVGMKEQAAITLADVAHRNDEMQDAVIDAGGVQPLLTFMRLGTQLGQEHAARAIWHLAAHRETHAQIVGCGAISELVQLLKTGSAKAQEMAAAAISELALGAVQERQIRELARKSGGNTRSKRPSETDDTKGSAVDANDPDDDIDEGDRLVLIAEASGILPLVTLLNTGTIEARENAAGALWHLALDKRNQGSIARLNGISPLVTILDDGTPQAHKHASDALARLAVTHPDNQAQIAKHCVALLANQSTGAQQRSAQVLRTLAQNEPGSPVVIVNAGAISPLVTLLSSGAAEVKEEAARALSTLAFNSPSTQLAIASGLVVLVGTGSADAQEHVTQLLLTLAQDEENCVAIAKAGAIPRLVVQLRGGGRTSVKAQELAAAVLSHLSATEDSIKAITAANGIRPLVTMLSAGTSAAQAHAASVLSDMARSSSRNQNQIISEGGITPLVNLLNKEHPPKSKAAAAGALLALSQGSPDTQKAVADAGAIKLLVALLSEEHDAARKKAAGAIAALASGSTENQDAVEKNKGIGKLVSLLDPTSGIDEEVSAEAAAALAVLARGNQKIQDKVANDHGIKPLVKLLQGDRCTHAKEEAASALWSLSAQHKVNQDAVAEAGGIAPLVAVLGLDSVKAQEQAAGALAALALDNATNEASIAGLVVSLLGTDDKQASAKAARAISRLARAHASNQRSIANAGGVKLLVDLLDVDAGGVNAAVLSGPAAVAALANAKLQKKIASAIWSMAFENTENQMAIANAGGIPPLIALLEGHPEVHKDVAGAIWALASNKDNQRTISKEGGIAPLVELLKNGSRDAQETAAGALHALAETADNRVSIAKAGGIPLLVALFDGGSQQATEQAAGALRTLAHANPANQLSIANELVAMLKNGSPQAQEHVTELLRNLAQDPENRTAIAKAGAVPELVRQLEMGSEKAMGMAASGLALIALKSAEHRATVTNELVKLLGSNKEAVRQRASEALTDMASDDSSNKKTTVMSGGGAPLVNLLKDGLKDGRVEAQEYALRSLLAIGDTAGKESIVEAGCIKPLIMAISGGKLSAVAQEHAATVLSGLAPMGENATLIKNEKGIDPLVSLLSSGTADAKGHAASTLAQLARRAMASREIAEAGAVSAFVQWLVNPSLGPPEVAARALSEIALNNMDTQTQIAEEGAISPLVEMLTPHSTHSNPNAELSAVAQQKARSKALGIANVAAGALATLAKDNIVNQLMITEDAGIPPLVDLLKEASADEGAYESPTRALWHLAATEDNQTAIARAGGIAPLVTLLTSHSDSTAQYAAAALCSLARDHTENQVALAKAGAIAPLVELLGSDSADTQEHAVGALLYLASQDAASRNAVVQRLVAVLDLRNAAAQMKSAEALAVLAARSDENRKAITAANAVEPLVRLLGDGRRVRTATPQERAAAVLADLARSSDNKKAIVEKGGVNPLVAMLSSDSPEAQKHAAGALWQLAALGNNRATIVSAGAIPLLVKLLAQTENANRANGTDELMAQTQRFATGALWHLASSADNKTEMVVAGAIPLLVAVLHSKSNDARENASAVLSSLARTQGGNKKAIHNCGGIKPLVALLSDPKAMTQRHAACALWGLSDGKDGVYDKQIAEAGAIQPLISMLQLDDAETRGFAAACLLCLCKDIAAHQSILESGGADLLQTLSYHPTTWLRGQVIEMLNLLGIPVPDPDDPPPAIKVAREQHIASGGKQRPQDETGAPKSPKWERPALAMPVGGIAHSSRSPPMWSARMKFHFFSFQIHGTTGRTSTSR